MTFTWTLLCPLNDTEYSHLSVRHKRTDSLSHDICLFALNTHTLEIKRVIYYTFFCCDFIDLSSSGSQFAFQLQI